MIGIDDTGKVKDLADKKKLLESLPNKIRESLGVVADVQLKKRNSKEYINIKIKPYENPISYKGKFYRRSGSTTQEINNAELHRFLLNKSNTSWESVLEDKATKGDVDEKQLSKFKELAKTKSLPAAKERTPALLLAKMHLTEKGKLTRAGILLFGKSPQQFFPGSFIKVGKFSKDEDLLSGEEIKGNLFIQAEQALEILKNKYLVSEVAIKGLYRTENLEYPESALREALVNAIAHKDYSGSHIQIKVYPDKLTFWNAGVLPQGLTVALLKKAHPSHPHNKLIADTFYAAGLIERWGHGTVKMVRECVKAGLPEPTFEEYGGGILVTFAKDIYTEEYLRKKGVNDRQLKAVLHIKDNGSISNNEYQEITGTTKRTASRDLTELLQWNLLSKTGNTGKGTVYTLRGHKGDKGDIKGTLRGQDKEPDGLESKLNNLKSMLGKLKTEPVKEKRNEENTSEVFNKVILPLKQEIVKATSKEIKEWFEELNIMIWTDSRGHKTNKEAKDYLEKNLKNLCSEFRIDVRPQGFKPAGAKAFSIWKEVNIYLGEYKYSIGFDRQGQNAIIEKMYHQLPTKAEIKKMVDAVADTLYDDIARQVERITKEQ